LFMMHSSFSRASSSWMTTPPTVGADRRSEDGGRKRGGISSSAFRRRRRQFACMLHIRNDGVANRQHFFCRRGAAGFPRPTFVHRGAVRGADFACAT
jgi:hypothetical protein